MENKRVLILKEQFQIRPHRQTNIDYHSHNFFELVYVIDGSALHVLEKGEVQESRMVQEGDYFIIDYGTRHCYQSSQECIVINCLFLPEIIHDTLADCHSFDEVLRFCLMRYYRRLPVETPVNHIFHDTDGKIRKILLQMQTEYEEKQLGYEEIFQYGLMEIVICTVRKLVEEENLSIREKNCSETIQKVISYLSVHYDKKNLLSNFCAEYHYSAPYISRAFKEETGYTIQKYIQKIRIEKSCELLLGTELPIQQIAHEVGYEDTKFYYQLFRKMVHMSPREYRKKIV